MTMFVQIQISSSYTGKTVHLQYLCFRFTADVSTGHIIICILVICPTIITRIWEPVGLTPKMTAFEARNGHPDAP
ncbi:hypothetical protein ACN38_g7116 [Penicillium nordicum]|uniref:Uncharacterized protein n=1 Tax=Penicillium nordicum TaxID=229535 RepID=A0A0N0RYK0_9EURO|nr:hypothetical protein ACN38_g7116 [Penicillium nordicum]